MSHSPLLIESKYAAGAAVVGFLLALFLSGGSLMAGFGALALIGGIGWAGRRMLQRKPEEHEDD